MTLPAETEFYALVDVIEKSRPADAAYGPGAYLIFFVSQHVKAEEILFVDLLPDRDRTFYSERYGRLFIITRSDVVFVDYEKAVQDRPEIPSDRFGQATITFYPRNPGFLKSITWSNRDLTMTDQSRGFRDDTPGVGAGAIHVAGDGWEIDLPVERRSSGGDEYFARLRAALVTSV